MNQKLIIRAAAGGLLVGCVLGMIGTAVPSDKIRNVLWAVDSCGLILAAALLTSYCFKRGYDVIGAGFLIFAIAQSIVFSSCAVNLDESIPAFGTGTCLWALVQIKHKPVLKRNTQSSATFQCTCDCAHPWYGRHC